MRATYDVIALMLMINPVIVSLAIGDLSPLQDLYSQGEPTSGLPFVIVYGLVFSVCCVFLATKTTGLSKYIRLYKWPLAIGLMSVLSAAWANDQRQVLQDGVFFLNVIVFFVYLATSRNRSEIISLLIIAMRLLALVSVIFYFLMPDLSTHQYFEGSAFRGVFEHKSALGLMLAVHFILLIMRKNPRPSKVVYFELVLLAILMLTTKSITAIAMVLMFLMSSMLFSRIVRVNGSVSRVFLSLAIASFGLFILLIGYSSFLGVAGRDVTLTGRLPIWQLSVELGSERALLGHGHKAFFKDDETGFRHTMQFLLGQPVAHPHNSYVAAFLDFGIFGAVLFTGYIISRVAAAFKNYARFGSKECIHLFSFLITFLVLSLVESSLLYGTGVYFGIFFLISYPEALTRLMGQRKLNSPIFRPNPTDLIASQTYKDIDGMFNHANCNVFQNQNDVDIDLGEGSNSIVPFSTINRSDTNHDQCGIDVDYCLDVDYFFDTGSSNPRHLRSLAKVDRE